MEDQIPKIDTGTAAPARIYDYLIGGKDHFEVDRQAAEEILSHEPRAREAAVTNRAFLARAVRYLAAEAGVRQFLDIGTGIPAAGAVHEIAQSVAPESRVVYVDNDPIVLTHAKALLVSSPEGACDYIDANLRDPERILRETSSALDLGRPVALLLVAILHFLPDADRPAELVTTLLGALPRGSYLVITHANLPEGAGDRARAVQNVYAGSSAGSLSPRRQDEIARFFDGLKLVEPGLVDITRWRPDRPYDPDPGKQPAEPLFYGAVGMTG